MSRPGATNRVRIIGGEHRGRILQFPDAAGLRPTADRVRETLFNWLQAEIPGACCLDLFAGSGVLGFEAVSRGASHVTMIERDRKAFSMLEKSSKLLNIKDKVNLVNRDALQWLRTSTRQFDVVFLDPPFNMEMLQPVIDCLAASSLLSPGALIYIEHDLHETTPSLPVDWTIRREKKAGQVYYMLVETGR